MMGIVILVQEAYRVMVNPPSDFTTTLLSKEQVAKDTFSFYFTRPNPNWDFLPGQYVRMKLLIENPDDRGSARFFSISSSPAQKNYFSITTRIIQSTFKKTLIVQNPGKEIHFFGPVGGFVLKEEEREPHVFLAGGIGITPFHSMLLYANEKRLEIPIVFFASFTTDEEMIFYDELTKISLENPNIKVVYTLTAQDQVPESWQGEKGRISADMIKKYAEKIEESLFYIAGPPPMVSAMIEMVVAMGIENSRIKKENFIGY